ncbi:MAG: DUF1778 domain-containing protein [Betaproteobacteria bacterium]|nr:DUF1778 domain-containing protein [Betaproteobacteria bacterium]
MKAMLNGNGIQEIDMKAPMKAKRAPKRERVIRLSGADAAFLMTLLEKPPAPNARLRKAFQTYKKKTLDAEDSTFNW